MIIRPTRLEIYRTTLPLRRAKRAPAAPAAAAAVVVGVQFEDGHVGWGEALARETITGESTESVIEDLQTVIWPRWAGQTLSPDPEPLMPNLYEGRCINAALCAFDLACVRRLFDDETEIASDVLQALSGRTQMRREIDVPVSGVLGQRPRRKTGRHIHLMQWYGIDHFKMKLSDDETHDAGVIQAARRQLGKGLAEGTSTLRVDVNGQWSADETPQRVTALKALGICAVEQPIYCAAQELVDLSRTCSLPLIADESLLTEADAEILLAEPHDIWWNIRLCKNGGLVRSLRLAQLAARNGVTFVVGCAAGQSSLLSAAQRCMLRLGPGPRFVEGNYGRWALRGDITTRTLTFGYGGRLKPLTISNLGVTVDPAKLGQFGQRVATLTA